MVIFNDDIAVYSHPRQFLHGLSPSVAVFTFSANFVSLMRPFYFLICVISPPPTPQSHLISFRKPKVLLLKVLPMHQDGSSWKWCLVDCWALGTSGSTAQSTHRVATATFWRTFHHDGKISPAWWGWGGGARSPSFIISTITYKVVQVHAPA